jgi:hypothetical protein
VEDISVPPHASVGGASAEAEPFQQPENCIGFIHSHHSMGAFHSGTDDAHVDRNYPISITVAKRIGQTQLEFDCISFATTPCGQVTITKPQLRYVTPPPDFDTQAWLAEAKANVDKNKRKLPALDSKGLYPETVLPYDGFTDHYVPMRFRTFGDDETVIPERNQPGIEKGWGYIGKAFTASANGTVLSPKELDAQLKDPEELDGASDNRLGDRGE